MANPPITILHVDDDEGFTELVAEYFEHRSGDISVRTARNGENALEHLASADDVDCVVSDFEMPGLNGLDLLTEIRKQWPDLPFILYTGQGSEGIAERAISAGVTDYLQKGNDKSQFVVLANRVRNAVAKYRAERAVERNRQRTQAQFELLAETVEEYAIFFLDENGVIQTWNRGAEKIKGYTKEEIVGEHFSVFYREQDVDAGIPERNLQQATSEGRVKDEGWRVCKDGSQFWADVTITALREDGELQGFAKITRDNTQHYREQQLLRANERLEEHIAAISHDLRSPLSVAQGNVELARETGDLERLDAVSKALERTNELLDHLNELAKDGKAIQAPDPVDLRVVAEDSWNTVETKAATLVVEETVTIRADRQRLQQLFENLIKNSIRHAGPDVTVRVGPLEDGFFVADDGPGIPEKERDRVFEREYTTDADGSGFGLTICRWIAEAHGWSISVTEEDDGGARFEITGVEFA